MSLQSLVIPIAAKQLLEDTLPPEALFKHADEILTKLESTYRPYTMLAYTRHLGIDRWSLRTVEDPEDMYNTVRDAFSPAHYMRIFRGEDRVYRRTYDAAEEFIEALDKIDPNPFELTTQNFQAFIDSLSDEDRKRLPQTVVSDFGMASDIDRAYMISGIENKLRVFYPTPRQYAVYFETKFPKDIQWRSLTLWAGYTHIYVFNTYKESLSIIQDRADLSAAD